MKTHNIVKFAAFSLALALLISGCFFGKSAGTEKQSEKSSQTQTQESVKDDKVQTSDAIADAPTQQKDDGLNEKSSPKITPKLKKSNSPSSNKFAMEEMDLSGGDTYHLSAIQSSLDQSRAMAPRMMRKSKMKKRAHMSGMTYMAPIPSPPPERFYDMQGTESYTDHGENTFQSVAASPLSTFSIDVDAAAYGNIRRFINNNQLPPAEAVRLEEMINYFAYDYKTPTGKHPFAVHIEAAPAPWNKKHKLVHIGLKGKEFKTDKRPASNLVFLLDVSGSMNRPNKLPLLKKSFALLINQLTEKDRVSIAVYAGAAGCVLEPTPGNEKRKIMEALNQLRAGGSTAGGAGIELAYSLARESFIKKGNNRVIIATDGDFNVGASSDKAMEDLIEDKRKSGVYLTVLGFGMGNYKDSKMEILADKGNGNYAYIDNILEAKKVFVQELGATLFTIAKDVKLQVEFNPIKVAAYRLIGYENRKLKDQDFNNDKKDAGELGAGHTVTALYEIIPVGVKSEFTDVDKLKYQRAKNFEVVDSEDILTVKLRYKKPHGKKSILLSHVLENWDTKSKHTSDNFRFSAAVASFGMLLKKSEYLGTGTYASAINLAKSSKGKDEFGYRAEFIRLIEKAELLGGTEVSHSGVMGEE